jgi:hypothetical protein
MRSELLERMHAEHAETLVCQWLFSRIRAPTVLPAGFSPPWDESLWRRPAASKHSTGSTGYLKRTRMGSILESVEHIFVAMLEYLSA